MKSFKEYCEEYNEIINTGLAGTKYPRYVIKRCIWILYQWELENNINTMDKEQYNNALQEVDDPKLLEELQQGYKLKMQMKKGYK